MKVLLVTQFFDSTRGGGEVVFFSTAKRLAERGHKVHVIRHKINDVRDINLPVNLKVTAVNPSLAYAGGLPSTFKENILYIINAVQTGLKIIREEKIDIIHTNNYTPVFVGIILSKITFRPLVVTIHDVASTNGLKFWQTWMNQFKLMAFLHSLVGYIGEILTVKLPPGVIHTVSDLSKDDILQIRKNAKVEVVPNGLDLVNYPIDKSKITFEDSIIFIGRAVYYKNLDVVIRAMKKVIVEKPNAVLTVVGDGPVKENWRRIAKDCGVESNVNFLGYVSHQEKLNLLKSSTALVLPSTWEGFGMVILESWAFNKPVIVSNVRPLSDIVDDKINGYHASYNNPDEWAKRILSLLKDKNLSQKMGANGYAKLVDEFSIESNIEKLESLYLNMLSSKNSV